MTCREARPADSRSRSTRLLPDRQANVANRLAYAWAHGTST